MTAVFEYWLSHPHELASRFGQHVWLVAISTLIAAAVGIPLGIAAARRPHLSAPLVGFANTVQTIPSLAMFGFLLPMPVIGGVGARAAIVVLILYGLLPIVRTTITGMAGINASIREAGVAMGMRPRELLRYVELPLALPSIVSGVRVAAVVGVGSATIAAAIGAGGLGEYVYRGLSMVNTTIILAGAIPAALLALTVDAALWFVERQLSQRRGTRSNRSAKVALGVTGVVLVGAALLAARTTNAIVVGSKNFTEQVILGEILAQTLERETGLTVDRRLNLGGTIVCDRALKSGDIDVYVEYSGTALTAVFGQPTESDSSNVLERVRGLYADTGRAVLPALGFENTFAILVRGRDARELGLKTIDDVAREAPRWRAGFGYEFLERPDGFTGLARTYGLRFAGQPAAMDLSLSYRALASGQVDVIAGDSTAGLIHGLDLVKLEDNRRYFPPYDAVPVARSEVLLRNPRIRAALETLAGRISDADMRAMNHAVEVGRQDPANVARAFLQSRVSEQ